MSEQAENSESQSNVREVFIVKRSTKIDSDEYVSVQLKSSDDSIEPVSYTHLTLPTIYSV